MLENTEKIEKAEGQSLCNLPDLQNQADIRGIALDRVGITNVYFPIAVERKDFLNSPLPASARVKLFVHLPQEYKGANLSRFMQCLVAYENQVIDINSMTKLLDELMLKLSSKDAYARFEFDFYMDVKSPVTDNRAPQRYRCAFIGQHENGNYNFIIEANVVAASVCPCSRGMSLLEQLEYGDIKWNVPANDDYYSKLTKQIFIDASNVELSQQVGMGAHNQRSNIRVRLIAKPGEMIWLEDLIQLIEAQASAPVYPILKRPDEKFVTEQGYKNAKFSEDIARDVFSALQNHEKIESWAVRVYNEESIHAFDVSSYVKSDNWKF